ETWEKARRDPLTGLFNRETGIRAIRSALEDRAHPGELVGVMFCDLDGFKA
ncbi:MAG TPA: GGDEF domain-containing protein, partial [Actinobacteria bacterium]|nr:GGDEF domain-containing protein [Actinomycetota bacterium]